MNKKITSLFENANAMLAGGSVFSRVQMDFGTNSTYRDLDFFFETEEDYQMVYYKLVKLTRVKDTNESARLEFEDSTSSLFGFKGELINLVKIYLPHQETIERFDMKNSQFWSMYPYTDVEYNHTPDEIDHLVRNIELNIPLNIPAVVRILKYNQNKNTSFDSYIKEVYLYLASYNDFTSEDYKSASYSSLDSVGVINSRRQLVGFVLGTFLRNKNARALAKHFENLHMLPFEYMDEIERRGFKDFHTASFFNPNPQTETLEFMHNYYPEYTL